MDIIEKVKVVAALLRKKEEVDEEARSEVQELFDIIHQTEDDDLVELSMGELAAAFTIEHYKGGSFAAIICGNLIEHGFSAKHVTKPFIDFYSLLLEKSKPFFELYFERKNQLKNEEDEYELLDKLIKEKEADMPNEIKAYKCLDAYYPAGIAIFSSDRFELEKGRKALGDVYFYRDISSGCLWLNKLFDVLFNEKIIVIDFETRKGIQGIMSGIVDNFQLHALLMGCPELNDTIGITKEELNVFNGSSVQQMEGSLIGKWNMYNWEFEKSRVESSGEEVYGSSDYWIWGEGIPSDISIYDDHRVILLGKPAYSRGFQISRTFKNQRAGIRVDKVLTEEEIKIWLDRLKKGK